MVAPQYLSELLSHYSPSRLLRSQNSSQLIIPRISKSTAGGRSFSYLSPKLWNNLPNIFREADPVCQFKSRLKTYLFDLCCTAKDFGICYFTVRALSMHSQCTYPRKYCVILGKFGRCPEREWDAVL